MAKVRKKKSKQKQRLRNETQKRLQSLTPDAIRDQATAFLAASRYRDAILAFREVLKKGGDKDLVLPDLFRAYRLRHGQLLVKKMSREAETVTNLGGQVFEALPRITPEQLEQALDFLPVRTVMAALKEKSAFAVLTPETEKRLGILLVTEHALDLAEDLPEDARLRTDRPVMAAAAANMADGDWQAALHAMRPIGRTSPFADLKTFARVMAAWERQDRSTLKKALPRLGANFPFKGLRTLLAEYAEYGSFKSVDSYPDTATLLMGPGIHKISCRDRIQQHMAPLNLNGMAAACRDFARLLKPESPDDVLETLAEIIGKGINKSYEDDPDLLPGFLERLIHSHAERKRLFLKIESVCTDFLSHATPDYLKTLKTEFPDAKERGTAYALILLKIAGIIKHQPDVLYDYEEELFHILAACSIPGSILDSDLNLLLLTLVRHAVRHDPGNRLAYDMLQGIPAPLAEHRKVLTTLYETMAAQFDDDPAPCLELARLYSLKNAFRKAQAILQTAYDRAPHDVRVKEARALAFVISAQKNLPKEKWHLVDRDLDRAVEFGLPILSPVITGKRLLAEFLKAQKFSAKTFHELTKPFIPVQQMQCFLLLQTDVDSGDYGIDTRGMASCFKGLQQQITGLSPRELMALLPPLDDRFTPLYPTLFYARPLLGTTGKILSTLPPEDLMSLVIPMAQNQCTDVAIRALKRKTKTAGSDHRILLGFYHTALEAISANTFPCPKLAALVDKAGPDLRERLRQISRSLSEVACYPLKDAFERFEFDRPAPPGVGPGPAFPSDLPLNEMFSDLYDIMMNAMNEDSGTDLEEDRGEPLFPWDLDVASIFGNTCDPEEAKEIIFDLTVAADGIVNGPARAWKRPEENFIAALHVLLDLMHQSGIRTTAQYREAGRKLAEALAYSRLILEALGRIKSKAAVITIPEHQHFMLGFRSGA
ncbi:tetratricopeptide repeat protein [Desulfotignum phosphitoxidans]|uniref:Uncharacterized protein n=1 Tax=Desulfotignum phosphitoxidans DSM 13687 TaxID=1286635 RepID=S0FYS8_9BACT|nr:tetratricopeptide repeat protein [Desulfotignum phosphitoxidans]EMS78349.1 hypothetical protein Dpo_8c00160 [Desulfotignum phosphitoxidans DSM 13687]